jgi:hypothetical protein
MKDNRTRREVSMKRTLILGVGLAVAACGADDGGNAGSDGTAASEGGITLTAGGTETGTSSTPTSGEDASQSDTSDSAEEGSEAGTVGGGGGGPVVPCGDDGTADPGEGMICFFDPEMPDQEPAATLEHSTGQFMGTDALYIRLTMAPWFVDNTYGANAINWPGVGHSFNSLVGSDHAEIHLKAPGGETIYHFKTDYIDDSADAASGYECLGVWGGDGEMLSGDIGQILAANSSLSRNLNERGYADYTTDSPATDENYTPNADAPNWDFRVVYEVWIALDSFDAAELPVQACIEFIHASPAKEDDDTKEVLPEPCPPGWGCYNTMGCGECDEYDPDAGDLCDPTEGIPPEG